MISALPRIRSLVRCFSTAYPFAFINGVDSIGLANAITPTNLLHVSAGEHIGGFSEFMVACFRSSESFLSVGTDILGLGMGPSVFLASILIKSIFLPLTVSARRYSTLYMTKQNKALYLQMMYMKRKSKGETRGISVLKNQIDSSKSDSKISLPSILSYIEIPFHIFTISAIEYKSTLIAKTSAGALKFLWINNILLSDPFFIAPALSAILAYFLTKEVNIDKLLKGIGKYEKAIPYIMPAAIFLLTSFAPAYIPLYGLGIVGTSIATFKAMKQPLVKQILWGESLPEQATQPLPNTQSNNKKTPKNYQRNVNRY